MANQVLAISSTLIVSHYYVLKKNLILFYLILPIKLDLKSQFKLFNIIFNLDCFPSPIVNIQL